MRIDGAGKGSRRCTDIASSVKDNNRQGKKQKDNHNNERAITR